MMTHSGVLEQALVSHSACLQSSSPKENRQSVPCMAGNISPMLILRDTECSARRPQTRVSYHLGSQSAAQNHLRRAKHQSAIQRICVCRTAQIYPHHTVMVDSEVAIKSLDVSPPPVAVMQCVSCKSCKCQECVDKKSVTKVNVSKIDLTAQMHANVWPRTATTPKLSLAQTNLTRMRIQMINA